MTDKTDRAAWSALAVMEEGAKVAREMQQIAERMLKGLPDQVNVGVQSGVKNSLKEVHSGLEAINKALTRGGRAASRATRAAAGLCRAYDYLQRAATPGRRRDRPGCVCGA